MKKLFVCLFAALVLIATACKGTHKTGGDLPDSGQSHVGNSGPTDSSKYPVTPTESGGKDSSGNGSGTTNAPKDTLKTN